MMRKRTFLSFLGAVLLVSAAPVVYGAARPSAAQSTTKTSSSKSKKRKKTVAKPKGQKAPTADRIKEIQTALQKDGSYQGEPNGKWDDATVEAMKKYQDKNGITPTGKIDALSLEKLGLGSDTAGKGAPVPAVSSAPVHSSAPAPSTTQQ
ncbi:MAG: peptidoglycan-binding protein [Acidobacteriia bacterium]|nr:peptidoglycan-binding protein [Terriglobia bacterium]